MTESMLLGLAGGVAGLILGGIGVRMLLALSPGNIPRINAPEHSLGGLMLLDWRVMVFLLGISLATGLLFGLFPALGVSRLDVNAVLKASRGRSCTGIKASCVRGVLAIRDVPVSVC